MLELIKVMAVKKRKKVAASSQLIPTSGKDFLLAALDMSWRLAVVVLVPILGGFQLDKLLDTLPALTIIGFIIAMGGMGFVVWRAIKEYS